MNRHMCQSGLHLELGVNHLLEFLEFDALLQVLLHALVLKLVVVLVKSLTKVLMFECYIEDQQYC